MVSQPKTGTSHYLTYDPREDEDKLHEYAATRCGREIDPYLLSGMVAWCYVDRHCETCARLES